MFNLLKTYIFGKILRTLEYPDGELYTVKIHYPQLERLKSKIAQVQPPPYPTCVLTSKDIRQLALWHAPAFTEPLRTDGDIRAIPDGAWIYWSKYSEKEFPIPRRGVKLDTPVANTAVSNASLVDGYISLVKRLYREKQLSTGEYDRLIDLIIEKNEGICTLARNFSSEPEEFVRHARRQMLKLPEKSILVSTMSDTSEKISSNV